MRILHAESSLGWGGQENRTLNEMIGLRERGHQIAVVSRPGARLLQRAQAAGFETFAVDMRGAGDLPALWRLRRLLTRLQADIVNTHSGRDTQLAGLAARTLVGRRPRIVRTRHLALPITSQFSYSIIPDRVVAVSRFVERYLIEAGVPAARVCTVPTGIDFNHYQAAAGGGNLKAELGLASDSLLIGTVAILRAKKGHAEILSAAARVLAAFPQAHFVFAGDGPQTANLQARITAEGLDRQVHLLGLRSDVSNVLQSLDLFVLPTHQEALGTAFIEAAALAVPAIGSRIDGVPEVIQDGVTGLLVPVRDSDALAAAIIALLADPDRRRQMGRRASEYARSHFSREKMAAGMEGVYQALVEKR